MSAPEAFVYNATLERIIDGDTFDCVIDLGFDVRLHKQRVRLAGIDTPESRINTKRYPERAKEKVMGKAAKESDVATSVCFLASDAAAMITGTSILIDGGWTAK